MWSPPRETFHPHVELLARLAPSCTSTYSIAPQYSTFGWPISEQRALPDGWGWHLGETGGGSETCGHGRGHGFGWYYGTTSLICHLKVWFGWRIVWLVLTLSLYLHRFLARVWWKRAAWRFVVGPVIAVTSTTVPSECLQLYVSHLLNPRHPNILNIFIIFSK